MNPLIMIPARMAATRLPGKPLADIGGKPMIVRAWEQARASGFRVAVAAGDAEIVAAVQAAGGEAVLTDPALPSGSDRILAAAQAVDPDGVHEVVVNIQGDMPFASPGLAQACAALLARESACDIATLVAAEADVADRTNPDVVKAILALPEGATSGRIMNVGLHPHVSGRAHRIRALREFITHAKSLPGVWFATREEIADWYLANHEDHIPGQLG